MTPPDQAQLIQLRETLARRFSQSELQDLCFDLGIAYDELSGSTPGDKARELILRCVQHNRLADLITHGRRLRPDIEWPRIADEPPSQHEDSDAPDILKARRAHYEALYRILKPLARYDVPEPIELDTLLRISTAMRDWYFDAGGLYLSDRGRDPYFALKEALKQVIERPQYQASSSVPQDDCLMLVAAAASALRAALRDDIHAP